MAEEFKVGEEVIIQDKSWEGGKILVRGKIIAKKDKYYHVKPVLEDVQKLYDTDFDEYMQKYKNPESFFIPKNMLKKLTKSYPDDFWGYQ